jgi:hypothetical protein
MYHQPYQRRRPPKRRAKDYFMPFLIVTLIIVIAVTGWRTLTNALTDGGKGSLTEKVFLTIENGSAKAMMANKSEWKNAPNNIDLYSGERLKTSSDGRATLTFSDENIIRLNKDSEIEFLKLTKKEDLSLNEVGLEKGELWAKINQFNNPDSRFSVSTNLITADTKGGIFAITAPGTVYVLKGTVQVGIKYDDEVIKTINVGVGQQFVVDEQVVIDLNEEIDHELIFALSSTFKTSNWYRWNMQKDGAINAFEESEEEIDVMENEEDENGLSNEEVDTDLEDEIEETVNLGRLVSVKTPSAESSTSKSLITVTGLMDTEKIQGVYVDSKKATVSGNKWSVSGITLKSEGENTITIEAENLAGTKEAVDPLIVYYDKTPPAVPVIVEPVLPEGAETVEIDDIEQIISGTVSEDTQVVIVNDYRLGKYVPGSKKFEYYAKIAYGNLKAGENEYLIYAEDKAGNQSEAARIILILDQTVIDEVGIGESEGDEEDSEESETSEKSAVHEATSALPTSTATGGVKITSPNNGESFTTSDTEFDIIGEVPSNTAKVVVDDYTLSQYEVGDTTFTYKARASFKNLIIGQKNTYTATAYDEEDNVIGSASITIDVESGLSAAPTITIPTSSAAYTTTLNEVVIGGGVGKWISKVYLNDAFISDYIPGSETWRKTVTLSSGENTFTVHGEQNSEKTATSTITITYQP